MNESKTRLVRQPANGKVILLGEHAVVHGAPAMAVGLPNRMTVTAQPSDGPISLTVPAWGLSADVTRRDEASKALRELVKNLGIQPSGVSLTGETSLPAGAGLGASAAIASASARALCKISGKRSDFDILFSAVQASEKIFHGNPSGMDAAVALTGGVVRYSIEEGASPTGAPPPPLVIIHSGKKGNTAEMVGQFARKLETNPLEGDRRLNAMVKLTESGIDAMRVWDLPTLGSLMIENQRHLEWFGVSTGDLKKICALAIGAGALGAKLTGSGGGGCVVALVTPEYWEAVETAVTAAGFSVIPR